MSPEAVREFLIVLLAICRRRSQKKMVIRPRADHSAWSGGVMTPLIIS